MSTNEPSGSARMRVMGTTAPAAVVLIRIVVGGIFLSEGIQKFLFPAKLGPGRFAAQTPLPAPEVWAYLDGAFEIGCGILIIIGLLTRLATLPMIVNMIGAEVFTKVPVLLHHGFWQYASDARAELGQLFGLVFLLIVGAGTWSLDAHLASRRSTARPDATA